MIPRRHLRLVDPKEQTAPAAPEIELVDVRRVDILLRTGQLTSFELEKDDTFVKGDIWFDLVVKGRDAHFREADITFYAEEVVQAKRVKTTL